jgi:DNA end-binding protein Ku
MARPLWKGAISFGLVSIPVELHTAVHDHRPKFRMLHATDRSPVQFKRVCAREGKPVAWEDLVKGYEYSKGKFVILTTEDFEAAAVEKTKRIDILDFVEASEIDDRYFETPYYLTPATGGDHAYALLREAMREEQRIGIAKFILRETQHLAAIEVIDNALVLSMMRFSDELSETRDLDIPAAKEVRPNELKMARMLINNLAAEWDPSKYTDEYRDNLMKIIKAKMKGQTIELEPVEQERSAKVVDLMERLRQSLAAHEPTGKRTKTTKAAVRSTRTRATARAKRAKSAA